MTAEIIKECRNFITNLKREFNKGLVFAGLQGSHARKEATSESDVDLVVVLDELTMERLDIYAGIVSAAPFADKACGFIAGREELLGWTPSELFLLYFDTEPLSGSLDFIKNRFDRSSAQIAALNDACAIYHSCCHNYMYESDPVSVVHLYKTAFFTLRALEYYRNGSFIKSRKELMSRVSSTEYEILETGTRLQNVEGVETVGFKMATGRLLDWSAQVIKELNGADITGLQS